MDVTLQQVLFRLAAYAAVAAVHGWALAAAAGLAGDPGPRYDGRRTLDPFAQGDPFGAACAAVFGLSWIRPMALDGTALRSPRAGRGDARRAGGGPPPRARRGAPARAHHRCGGLAAALRRRLPRDARVPRARLRHPEPRPAPALCRGPFSARRPAPSRASPQALASRLHAPRRRLRGERRRRPPRRARLPPARPLAARRLRPEVGRAEAPRGAVGLELAEHPIEGALQGQVALPEAEDERG